MFEFDEPLTTLFEQIQKESCKLFNRGLLFLFKEIIKYAVDLSNYVVSRIITISFDSHLDKSPD